MDSPEMEAVRAMFMALKMGLEGREILPRGYIEVMMKAVHANLTKTGKYEAAAHVLALIDELSDHADEVKRLLSEDGNTPPAQPHPHAANPDAPA